MNTITAPEPAARYASPERSPLEAKVWQQAIATTKDTIDLAGEQLDELLPNPRDLLAAAYNEQAEAIEAANTDRWTTSHYTAEMLVLLMLGQPFAAESAHALNNGVELGARQREEYRARASRYNHTFARVVACMPPDMIRALPETLSEETARLYGNQPGLDRFNVSELRQHMAGVSREAATLALENELGDEYTVRPGTTSEDLRGIDMILRHGDIEKYFDVKTANSFFNKLTQLEKRRRLTPEARKQAELQGYLKVTYTNNETGETTDVTIVDADSLGRVRDCRYEDPAKAAAFYAQQMTS